MADRFGTTPEDIPTGELFRRVANDMALLAKKEIELAKHESKAELKYEMKVMSGLGACAAVAFLGLNLALAAALIGLFGWQAACVVGAVLLVLGCVAGLFLWNKRVRKPIPNTTQMLKEDATWLKATINRQM